MQWEDDSARMHGIVPAAGMTHGGAHEPAVAIVAPGQPRAEVGGLGRVEHAVLAQQ